MSAESARRALALWLDARRSRKRLVVSPDSSPQGLGREELLWLGLECETSGDAGEPLGWISTLPPLQPAPPSPWGDWSGQTRLAELRELGVLPEALINFLALTLLEQLPDSGELLARDELPALWSPEQIPKAAVQFDFELLRKLNHAWLQRADLDRLLELALPYYQRIDWIPENPSQPVRLWLRELIRAVLPGLDFLSLLPPRTRLVFDYQPENYLRVPESREAMEREGARDVLRLFGQKALEESWLTPDRYEAILEELKRETPWRGRNLQQPIRVLLTGLPFGPPMEELLPLIERGAELDLPVRIKPCRERVLEFCAVFV
ncbi:MAG: hypothetical protein ACRD4D_07820 [Candidatus Acidiferrales bacterium]